MPEPFDSSVAEIRLFNRYYTGVIGLLDEHFLKSPFTLSEGRVLYELAHRDGLTASDLVQSLRLDPGYLSRILARFEKKKLLKRTPREEDRRQAALSLTAAGMTAFRQINKTSQDEIGAMVEGLDDGQLRRLTQSLAQVRRILARSRDDGPPLFVLRDHRVGDMGWIIHRQARLYAEEYGWNEEFEALVAEIAAKFIRNFDRGAGTLLGGGAGRRDRRRGVPGQGLRRGGAAAPAPCGREGARAGPRPPAGGRMHPLRPRQGLQDAHTMDERYPDLGAQDL